MPRTILCSAGTSIAGPTYQCPPLQELWTRGSSWEDDTSELEEAIKRRIDKFDWKDDSSRIQASAELNALHRLDLQPEDKVVLFATDSADGRCCAEMVSRVLLDHFQVKEVKVEQVPGLQVRDGERLRKEGLANLSTRLIHYLSDPQIRYEGGCVLNTNGGYKGLVPIFATLGMIYRAPVVYIFEFGYSLIRIPPLPVGVARDLFERAFAALQWAASQEDFFDPEEFYRRIPGYEEDDRDRLGGLLETTEIEGREMATLSSLTTALFGVRPGEAIAIRWSGEARKYFEGLDPEQQSRCLPQFTKLSNPAWRAMHHATKHRSDLEFHPEKKAYNPCRFAGFTHGAEFYLCWFRYDDHDGYDKEIPKHQRRDYQLDDFELFQLDLSSSQDAVDEEEDDYSNHTWLELRDELLKSQASLQALQEDLKDLKKEQVEVRGKNRELLKELTQLRKAYKELEAECRQVNYEKRELEKDLRDSRTRSLEVGDEDGTQVDELKAAAKPLLRTEVTARLVEEKKKSFRFAFSANGRDWTGYIPKSELTGGVNEVGCETDVYLAGFDCPDFVATSTPE